MSTPADTPSIEPRELADLSALADGSLDPARRAAVSARIAASPELSALYERERRVVELLHEARATDRAPASLRARIEAQRPSRAVRTRRRISYGGAFAGALAAAALAVALLLPAGSPGAPSVSQAAALAVLGPNVAAPTPDPATPAKLDSAVDDEYFPNWSQRFASPATGARSDRINGRLAVTVYYQWRGKQLAYTIVASPALHQPTARVTLLNGTEYRAYRQNGRMIVTWRRDNHTCVLSAKNVPAIVLQRLAAWEPPGIAS
jgi:anti-sigma factor RsiW